MHCGKSLNRRFQIPKGTRKDNINKRLETDESPVKHETCFLLLFTSCKRAFSGKPYPRKHLRLYSLEKNNVIRALIVPDVF